MIEKNIIQMMKSQHRGIERFLENIDSDLKAHEYLSEEFLVDEIKKLRAILDQHIELEDNNFYPSLLNKMNEVGEDQTEVLNFIEKIDAILENTYDFLDNYNTAEKIHEAGKDKFRSDFIEVSTKLEIRINVEELSIYQKWADINKK